MIRDLEDNLDDWLAEELDNYMDDDYLVFDCPGVHTFLSIYVMYKCTYAHPDSSLHECINVEITNGEKDYEKRWSPLLSMGVRNWKPKARLITLYWTC